MPEETIKFSALPSNPTPAPTDVIVTTDIGAGLNSITSISELFDQIPAGQITLAQIADINASTLLGRSPAGDPTGPIEEITLGSGLVLTGTVLSVVGLPGSTVPTTVQGDLLFASGANVLAALTKDASATRYLSNTGASNNPAWAQVNLANGVTGDLPYANLVPASAPSILLGRGDGGAGDWQEITLGSGITMVGTTISATGSGGTIGGSTGATDNAALRANGTGGATVQASNLTISDDAVATEVGYLNIPQNSQSADYTLLIADRGQHIFHPVGDNNPRTFTIPANASVAYPVGTAITFVNKVNVVTIAITSDTLTWAEDGSTGSRALAANAICTALKITTTEWLISGVGLS